MYVICIENQRAYLDYVFQPRLVLDLVSMGNSIPLRFRGHWEGTMSKYPPFSLV